MTTIIPRITWDYGRLNGAMSAYLRKHPVGYHLPPLEIMRACMKAALDEAEAFAKEFTPEE